MHLDKQTLSLLSIITFICIYSCSFEQEAKIPEVAEVNLQHVDPTLFSEEEWYIPYYLKHFAAVANSVVDTGAKRGYFDLSVWRGSRNHHTYNARIMEGILSLVWFYCTDREWNIYYNDQNLKKRIEASLLFWCSIQHKDGRFSEYGPEKWSLAPTAFATKFIGRALWLLHKGPKIDPDIYEKSRAALRKAIYIGLTHEGLWKHGRSYTNQYANLWGGALAYLSIWPNAEISALLKERFTESMTEFQSPAGFFYEKDGPDWGYNLSTHHSDLQVAWEYADEAYKRMIINKTKLWYEWLSYNAVKEPESMCYFLNRAIETRQQKGCVCSLEEIDPAFQRWSPQTEFIPTAHAFELSETEVKSSRKKSYSNMLEAYPEVAKLDVGEFNAFTPYAFLHHNMEQWHPTDEQKQISVNNLPCFSSSDFIHLRSDERSDTKYIYIKTPVYYATFNHGKIVTDQQRLGLGLLWNPRMGTVLQSQSRTDQAAYGTKILGEKNVFEADDLQVKMKYEDERFEQPSETFDLDGGTLEISYNLGSTGIKNIEFAEGEISVDVQCPGEFNEYLPLVLSDEDNFTIQGQKIEIQNSRGSCTIKIKNVNDITQEDFETDLISKHCRVIKLSAKGNLSYKLEFSN
ncbi:MAG: hypothetical protein HKN87_21855 [Saprospiraceae bacterium]|nr:hypothetical protein [Saprospiraceae bacterium]